MIGAKSLRRLLLEQVALAIAINFTVNAIITWFFNGSGLVLESLDTIPMWGLRGFFLDLVITTFIITLLTTISVSRVAHKAYWAEREPLFEGGKLVTLAQDFVRPQLVLIALLIALVVTVVLVSLVIAAMLLIDHEAFTMGGYVLFKAVYASALAVTITILVVLDSFKRSEGPR